MRQDQHRSGIEDPHLIGFRGVFLFSCAIWPDPVVCKSPDSAVAETGHSGNGADCVVYPEGCFQAAGKCQDRPVPLFHYTVDSGLSAACTINEFFDNVTGRYCYHSAR